MPSTVPGPPGMSDAVQPLPQVTAFPYADSFSLMNIPLPGKWTLLEASRKYKYQIQAAYGFKYANILPTGVDLVTAKFKGEFWSHSDFKIYSEIEKQLVAQPVLSFGVTSAALGIGHPTLRAMGVTAVVLLEHRPAVQEEGGLWVVHLDFLEWKKPVPVAPKPTFAIPDVAPTKPTVVDAQDAEIKALHGQTASLMGKL